MKRFIKRLIILIPSQIAHILVTLVWLFTGDLPKEFTKYCNKTIRDFVS